MNKILVSVIAFAASITAANAQYSGNPYGYPSGTLPGGYPSGSLPGYGTGSNPSSHYVNPYVRNNGTYVAPHYQTNPNSTTLDNYETRGNYNPYTGQYGRRNPW